MANKMVWSKQISVVYICQNEEGKRYAMADRFPQCYDIFACLKKIPNLLHANVCDSYKQAKYFAEAWNESYKRNGNYWFS